MTYSKIQTTIHTVSQKWIIEKLPLLKIFMIQGLFLQGFVWEASWDQRDPDQNMKLRKSESYEILLRNLYPDPEAKNVKAWIWIHKKKSSGSQLWRHIEKTAQRYRMSNKFNGRWNECNNPSLLLNILSTINHHHWNYKALDPCPTRIFCIFKKEVFKSL